MTDTNYTDFSPPAVNAAWLNDVNVTVYRAIANNTGVIPTTPVQLLASIGAVSLVNLSNNSNNSLGPSLVGFNPTLNYVAGTLGKHVAQERWNPCDYPWLCPTDGVSDCTTAINACVAAAATAGRGVYLPPGTFNANIVALALFNIEGAGMQKTIIKPFNTSLPTFKNMANPGSANFWRRSRMASVSLVGSGNIGNGFTFGDPAAYTTGDEQIGRVDLEFVEITGFNKGVFKTCGNIGNTYRSCRVQNNNYNYYAQSSDYASVSAPIMHTGLDTWSSGAWGYANLAGIFIKDRILGKGGWTFTNDVDLEGNLGYAIAAFADTSFDNAPDLLIEGGSWIEANATAVSVTIDTLTGTLTAAPVDIYVSGIKHVIARQVYLAKLNLSNGCNFVAEKCYADTVTPVFSLTMDATSTFIHDGAASNTGFTDQLVLAPYASDNWTSGQVTTSAYNTLPGSNPGVVQEATVRAGYSGTSLLTSSSGIVKDGLTFGVCNQFVAPQAGITPVSGITTVVGKWYAVSVQARWLSGPAGRIDIGNLSSATGGIPVSNLTSEWRQYNFVRKATQTTSFLTLSSTTASSCTMNIGAFQVVEFSNPQDAYNYLYRGRLATNNEAYAVGAQLSSYNRLGGGPVSFNSSSISCQLTNSAFSEILQANFGSNNAKIVVDMMLAGEDFNTGPTQAQPTGFTALSFSSVADVAQTFTIGAATVTINWVQISGNLYSMRGKITAGASTALNLAGIGFVKGK